MAEAATTNKEVPVHSAMSTPTHDTNYYSHHWGNWWQPWPLTNPAPHNSSTFDPRAYDAVAPWAYEHLPPYSPLSRYHYSALSPAERDMLQQKHHFENLTGMTPWRRSSFSSDLMLHPSRPGSLLEHYSLLNPVHVDANGNRWLNCYFDLRSFKPEEISVKLNTKERCIEVEASHEVNEAKEHYIKRHYSRKLALPEDVKVDLLKCEIKSNLTTEGLLCVEAALPKLTLEEARNLSTSGKNFSSNVFKIAVQTV